MKSSHVVWRPFTACIFCIFLITACSSSNEPLTTPPAPVQQPAKPTPSQEPPKLDPKPTSPAPVQPKPADPKPPAEEPAVPMENKAFKLQSPKPHTKVKSGFEVKGKARVFEAAFSYSLEDGHHVLAEGHVMAEAGAPAWADFAFTVKFTKEPTSPTGILTLYEISAKDGSRVNQLHIPVKLQ